MEIEADAPRVLVVDDSEIFRLVAHELLCDAGFRVCAAASTAEEAIELLDTGLGVDLVLMDVQLPGLSGPEALPAIRLRHPDLPVVLTSALAPADVADAVARSGATGFVAKSELDGAAIRSIVGY